MKNRFVILLTFLAAFAVSTPIQAAPPADLGADAAMDTDAAEGSTGDVDTGTDTGAMDTDGADTDGAMVGTDTGEATGGLEPADEIKSDEEAVEVAGKLFEAIKIGNAPMAVALALMLVVYLLRRSGLMDQVPEEHTKWAVAAVSITGYVIAALMLDGAVFAVALKNGLVAGAAAVGLGEMVLAKLFGKSKLGEAKAEVAEKSEEKAEEKSDEKSE